MTSCVVACVVRAWVRAVRVRARARACVRTKREMFKLHVRSYCILSYL